ncbi:MAG: DEAD/DEAH box helicase, partial [Lentisphaeria bacterium]|nr:DEAD/DEAH box helicase [Lentisphaeria bacterium]
MGVDRTMIMAAGKELKEVRSDSVVRTQEFFSDRSPLKRAAEFGGRTYERRIQQETMAVAVAEALEENHNLCVEAPTGVGKSFAYLVPAIYHARATRTPVLVTTETITLQEQLVNKDLPLLKDLTGLDFTFVLAKGRSNYLCKRRLDLATNGGYGAEMLPT